MPRMPSLTNRPCGAPAKRTGKPCTSYATQADGRCWSHSTLVSQEQRQQAGRRGALTTNRQSVMRQLAAIPEAATEALQRALNAAPDLSDVKKCELYLSGLIGKLDAGLVPPSVGKVMIEAVGVRLKLIELQQAEELLRLEDEDR